MAQNTQDSAAAGSVKSQLQQVGQQGAAAGLSNLASGLQNFTSGIFSMATKLMPWQAWGAIGIFILWWLGAFSRAKGSLAR